MSNQRVKRLLLISIVLICGCRAAAPKTESMDHLLQTVNYEVPDNSTNTASKNDYRLTFGQRAREFRDNVLDGAKRFGWFLAGGFYEAAADAFSIGSSDNDDDDPGYENTSRTMADNNLQNWLDQRDRWRDEDKR